MWVFRRQKSAYALSLFLGLIGIAAILIALWKTWPQVSSAKDPFSTFLALLGTESLDIVPGLEFKLVYLVAAGDAILILGVIVGILSVQRFYLPGRVVWYRCPFCHKDWKSSGTKGLVHCPHCRQLIHPSIVEKPVQAV